MGRHSSVKPRGWRSRSPIILLSALLVLALVGWFAVDFLSDKLRASSCDSTTVVNVTAAADIAPTVDQIGDRVSKRDEGTCYDINVISRDSSATAESLVVSGGTERPDVWIPESTIWLQRAQDLGAWAVPVRGTSIASSPVVLALTEDAAGRLGWPQERPSWAQVLGKSADLSIGLPDPASAPAGVSVLFGVHQLYGAEPDAGTAITTELRRLSPNTVSDQNALFTRLPGAESGDRPLDGFPASEESMLRHNVKQRNTPLVAVYAHPAVPALDYPFVVLPETAPDKREAAERFLKVLIDQDAAETLASAGFRTPDGEMLRDLPADERTASTKMTPIEMPRGPEIDQLLNEWAGVNRSSRMQVLLDISGSMNEAVPGTGRTRMAVTLQAAELGIGLMKPTTKLGLWLFSTNLAGDNRDYEELLPVKPLSEHLAGDALAKLRAVRALPNGGTGLYDSVLAAYQSSTTNFEPGRINLVVVLTDGRNDDAASIGRDQLLSKLKKLRNPRRPVQIIGIGIGPDIDKAELTAIASATGGQAFTTPDPRKITDIFYAALSNLLCQPPTCQPKPGG